MVDWQTRIGPGAVPIVCSRMHRVFWVPARYRDLIAAVLDGRKFTVRGIALRSGYSTKGAWAAFRSLEKLGIGTIKTTLGRRGFTRFHVQSDVRAGNVSITATSLKTRVVTLVRTVVETFSPTGGGERWLAEHRAWKGA